MPDLGPFIRLLFTLSAIGVGAMLATAGWIVGSAIGGLFWLAGVHGAFEPCAWGGIFLLVVPYTVFLIVIWKDMIG